MYREEGYTATEAVRSIFENNLFGLDIDLRAAQLYTFALLLKATAATQDPTILDKDILPHVYAMPEKEIFTRQEVLDFLGEGNATHTDALYNALFLMQQSQNLGSVMKFSFSDAARNAIVQQTTEWKTNTDLDLLQQDLWKRLAPYLQVLQVLTTKYEAVAANPPYMGSGNMNDELKEYLDEKYSLTSNDLSSVFMQCSNRFLKDRGFCSMINQASWMFKPAYEKYRELLINTLSESINFKSIVYLGAGTFEEINGEVVQSVCFTICKMQQEITSFLKLTKFKSSDIKHKEFLSNSGERYFIKIDEFNKFNGKQFGFWLKSEIINLYKDSPIKKYGDARQGIKTGNNQYFIKIWHEVSCKLFNLKWFPVEKGGEFKRWYGNNNNLLNWEDDGFEIKNFKDENGKLKSRPQNLQFFFTEGITWSTSAGENPAFRFSTDNFTFESSGSKFFVLNSKHSLYNFIGYFNSKVTKYLIDVFAPGIGFSEGSIKSLPYISKNEEQIYLISKKNIEIAKTDWDSRETSWDFEKHPIIKAEQTTLESAYQAWEELVTADFYQLHANETELNRIFIDIYGLQDELTPEVKLKDITILQEELNSNGLGDATESIGSLPIRQEVVMRQLISYLVGCLMGRYRLDKPGLHIAHPAPTAEEIAPYSYQGHTVEIDDDGIIPLMDNNSSFADNALIRIKHLLEAQWGGDKQLVDTINYLQSALGKDLETYLVKDFWKDHCSRYQKRPIYWLFASPKGAFQVITYMHRMNKYTVEKIRSNYLLRHISNLENRIAAYEADQSSLDRNQMRDFEKLKFDLIECREYDLQLKEVADQQIDFDLDDGVVINYAKFGSVVAQIK